MKYLSFAVLFFGLIGCQQRAVLQPDQPTVDTRLSKVSHVYDSPQGEKVLSENRYIYASDGTLKQIDYYSNDLNNNLFLSQYENFVYDQQGRLERRTATNQYLKNGPWLPAIEYRYAYPDAARIVETYYGADRYTGTPVWTKYSTKETIEENGLPKQITYFDRNGLRLQDVRSTYIDGRVSQEEVRGYDGNVTSTLQYKYDGQMAQVLEFVPKVAGVYSEQKYTYDAKGRLVRQEITKTPPVFCATPYIGSTILYHYIN